MKEGDEERYTQTTEVERFSLVRQENKGPSSRERKTLKRRVEGVMFADRVTPLRCSIIKQLSRLLRSNRDVNQGSHPSFIALGIRGRYGS